MKSASSYRSLERVDMKSQDEPAFPNSGDGARYDGMTLRDYFAGQVLAGICASYAGSNSAYQFSSDADYAYKYADAMIAERSRT